MYTLGLYNSSEVVKRTSQEVRFGSSTVNLYQETMSLQDKEAGDRHATRDKDTMTETSAPEEEEMGTNSRRLEESDKGSQDTTRRHGHHL